MPQYIEPILDGEYPSYAVEPVYRVASNTLPLALDQSVQGFRGIIPNITSGFQVLKPLPRFEYVIQSGKTRAAYANLTIVVTKSFPDNVRFEQVSRFKIQLEITPKLQSRKISPALKNDLERVSFMNFPMSVCKSRHGNNQLVTVVLDYIVT